MFHTNRAVTRHSAISAMFVAKPANIADIALARMTAPIAAIFGPILDLSPFLKV
jgi:hypothetical protein